MIKTYLSTPALASSLGQTTSDHQRCFYGLLESPLQSEEGMLVDKPALLGRVPGALPPVPPVFTKFQSRFFQLVTLVAEQIAPQVAGAIERYGKQRIGLVVGSSTSGIESGEQAFCHFEEQGTFPEKFHYTQQEMGSLSTFLKSYFDLGGPGYTISTACTSGGKALLAAKRLIETGVCDAVVTGGVDSLCRLTVRGFYSLGLVSDVRTNPFSSNRNGLNLGEAGCLMVLSRDRLSPSGERCVVLAGGGETSDAHHMSAPHPEGEGAIRALQSALEDAEVSAQEVGYVNAHGTGTPLNDSAEGKAINAVLGSSVAVSSTKPLTGHTLGAAGAIEAGICVALLQSPDPVVRPPVHLWDRATDTDIPSLSLVTEATEVNLEQTPVVVSTSFAFGGSNCAVVLRRDDA